MFLQLSHTRLNVFQFSRQMVLEVYRLTKLLPTDEKFAMVQQMRRAALSVHLNIAEGCSRKSENERKRYFEIARGSVIEVDTAFDMAFQLEYLQVEIMRSLGDLIIKIFKLLSGMINNVGTHH